MEGKGRKQEEDEESMGFEGDFEVCGVDGRKDGEGFWRVLFVGLREGEKSFFFFFVLCVESLSVTEVMSV